MMVPSFDDESASQDDCRLIDVVVLIAVPVSDVVSPKSCCDSVPRLDEFATHLNVPTPPASRINAVSVRGLPTQRIANARRICPCATTSTSPFEESRFSKLARWYFSLISAISASRRRTTSSGDLITDVRMCFRAAAIHRNQGLKTRLSENSTRKGIRKECRGDILTLHQDTHRSKYSKPPVPSPPSAPESAYSSTPRSPRSPIPESPQ